MNSIQSKFSLVSRLVSPPAKPAPQLGAPQTLFKPAPAMPQDQLQIRTPQPSSSSKINLGRIQRLIQNVKPQPQALPPQPVALPSQPLPAKLPSIASIRPKMRPVQPAPQVQIPVPTPRPKPRPQVQPVTQPKPVQNTQTPRGSVTSAKASTINQWFVPQFSKGGVNPNADCGPAAVSMVLRAHGFSTSSNLTTVRRTFMKVKRNNGTASNELAKGLKNGSNNRLKVSVITGNKEFKNSPKAMLNRIKSELAAGKQVILLTKNMAKIKRGDRPSGVNGHYVVIQKVNSDNSLVVADPGSTNHGKNRSFSYAVFEKSFHARQKDKMPNNLISVSR